MSVTISTASLCGYRNHNSELIMSVLHTHPAGQVNIECIQGDITDQPDMDAVVNAANAQLMPGGGVAGAIHRQAGPELAQACAPLAPIKPGEAVITPAFNLPNRHVIHCLGPVYGIDQPEDKLLAACYRNALSLGEANALASIAFPAISTGAFGYPIKPAAHISLTAIRSFNSYQHLRHIRFVLWNTEDLQIFQQALKQIFSNGD